MLRQRGEEIFDKMAESCPQLFGSGSALVTKFGPATSFSTEAVVLSVLRDREVGWLSVVAPGVC